MVKVGEQRQKRGRRTGKKTTSEAFTSRPPRKRGKQTGEESMQNLMHAHHVGTPTEVKVVIASWEAKLNPNMVNEEIPTIDWEHIIQDPRHTRRHQTLF